MLGTGGVLGTAVVVWTLTALLLWWGWLPGPVRRVIALLTGGVGIVFLVFALRAEGVRETTTTFAFLMGPPSVMEQLSASASLSYYILTAICLLLGTVGLGVGEGATHALRKHAMALALGVSFAVALLRFCLEKVAAHHMLVNGMGVIWLPPVVGAFFWRNLSAEGKGVGALVRALLVYAFTVRGFVALCVVLATALRLGSHYDVSGLVVVRSPFLHGPIHFSPGSPQQVMDLGVLPQLLFWTIFTVITGLLGALVEHLVETIVGPAHSSPGELAPAAKD